MAFDSKEYKRRWREENRDKVNAYKREWRKANRDKVKAQEDRYMAKPGNKEAKAAYTKRYRAENAELVTAQKRARRYGVTLDEAIALGKTTHCEICGTELTATNRAIDHCHTTGKIRGTICKKCNSALGFFNDDPALIQKAINYLEDA